MSAFYRVDLFLVKANWMIWHSLWYEYFL